MAKNQPTKKRTKKKSAKKKSAKARPRASARAPKGPLPRSDEEYEYEGWGGFTPKDRAVLRFLENNPSVIAACDQNHVSRGGFYERCRENPLLLAAREKARSLAYDRAEQRAYELGVIGVKQLVLHAGEPVVLEYDEHGTKLPEARPLTRTEYDTNLLRTILAAKKPKEYGTNRSELTGANGGPIQTDACIVQLTDEQVDQLPEHLLEEITGGLD